MVHVYDGLSAHRVNKIARKFWKVLKAYVLAPLALCLGNSFFLLL